MMELQLSLQGSLEFIKSMSAMLQLIACIANDEAVDESAWNGQVPGEYVWNAGAVDEHGRDAVALGECVRNVVLLVSVSEC